MKKNNLRLIGTFCLAFLTTIPLFAEIKLSAIFGNNMVLQRETNVNVWGTAAANATVEVTTSWNGTTHSTQALANGRWRLQVPTPVAGGPYTVTIVDRSDNHTVLLDNVLIGEVWICSGQSNMAMPMKGYTDQPVSGSAATIASSADSNLRYFNVPVITGQEGAQDTFRGQATSKRWVAADPSVTLNFSATAYLFGRKLREELNIPIGIVNSSWGGTRIEVWMSESNITEINPSLTYINAETSTYPNPLKSSSLFNYMINPMVGYGIRGAIWYQGEANTAQAADYQKQLPSMIRDWRTKWGIGDFPFYYVQLAPFGGNAGANNGANLREAQLNISNPALTPNLPNIGMACVLEAGEQANVHPADKSTVAKRLSNLAFSNIYGRPNINPYSPAYRSMTVSGNVATLTFETYSDTTYLTAYGNTLSNFEIAGANKVFYPAQASVSNKTVSVQSASVPKPTIVRYGFKNFLVGDLFGTNGVPASSFRTGDPKVPIVASWEASAQALGGRATPEFAPTFLDDNMTAPSGLTRGSGTVIPTTSASGGYWGGIEFSTATTPADGIAANKIFQLSLKSKTGKAVSYISIDKFNIRIATNAPIKYQIDCQIDNGAFIPCATAAVTRPSAAANFVLGPYDLSTIPELQNVPPSKTVTFRITPYEATGTGSFFIGSGTADTDADLSFGGTLSDVVVAVSDFTSVPFKVYPSVSTGNSIQTVFKNASKSAQIKVVNVNGQVLSTYNLEEGISSQSIEIAHFTEGVYFLILQDKGVVLSRKFIKQ